MGSRIRLEFHLPSWYPYAGAQRYSPYWNRHSSRPIVLSKDLPAGIGYGNPFLGRIAEPEFTDPYIFDVDAPVTLLAPGLSASVAQGSGTRILQQGNRPAKVGAAPTPSGPAPPLHYYLARSWYPQSEGTDNRSGWDFIMNDHTAWWFICWSDFSNPPTLDSPTYRTADGLPVFTYTIDPETIREDLGWHEAGLRSYHGDPRRNIL